MSKPDFEKLLGDLSDKFHKILQSKAAQRIIATQGHALSTKLYEKIRGDILPEKDIEKLAADGFQDCVMTLHQMGVKNVTIFNCNPSEEPSGEEDGA